MNVNVVRMFIPADRVEGDDDIGLEFADVADNLASHLINRMIDLRVPDAYFPPCQASLNPDSQEKDVFQS